MKKPSTIIILSIISVHIIIQIFYGPAGYRFASKKSIEEEEFKGVITNIYRDYSKWRRGMYFFQIKTEKEKFEMFPKDWEWLSHYSSIGDSIIKERGKLEIILRKQDGTSKTFALCDDMLYIFPPYK